MEVDGDNDDDGRMPDVDVDGGGGGGGDDDVGMPDPALAEYAADIAARLAGRVDGEGLRAERRAADVARRHIAVRELINQATGMGSNGRASVSTSNVREHAILAMIANAISTRPSV